MTLIWSSPTLVGHTTLVRLMFNHERFPSHLFKIKNFDNPMWTINHLIFNCPKFEKEFTELLNYLFVSGLTAPFNVMNLLASEEQEILNKVAFFSSPIKSNYNFNIYLTISPL